MAANPAGLRNLCLAGLLLAAVPWLLTPAAAAAQGPVARMTILPGEVSWSPEVLDNGFILSVSGQGIYLRQEFEAGQSPVLRWDGPDGGSFPDGTYQWELRVVPERSGGAGGPQLDKNERAVPPRSGGVLFERRPRRRPRAQSGSFLVERGSFVMTRPEPGPWPRQEGPGKVSSGSGSEEGND